MAEIIVLGDINVDILGQLDAPPLLGGDCLAPELQLHCGGVGANTSLALARWGHAARLLGCAGRDWFGDFVLEILRREGVDVTFVQQTEQTLTGLILSAVAPDGQRTMIGSRGANQVLQETPPLDQVFEGVAGVHLMGYNFLTPSVAQVAKRLLAEMYRRGGWVSFDVGMAPSQQARPAVLAAAKEVDTIFLSLDEATLLTGQQESRKALEALEQFGARDAVIKLGKQGCLFRQDEQVRHAPAFPVDPVDTTGAGDAFTAAFLHARLRGWPQEECALLANAAGAAAASVTGAGEQLPGPRRVFQLLSTAPLPAGWDLVCAKLRERVKQELPLVANAKL
ncbi:MAG: carbohydrate kinase family protein [Terriglobia bacterium]